MINLTWSGAFHIHAVAVGYKVGRFRRDRRNKSDGPAVRPYLDFRDRLDPSIDQQADLFAGSMYAFDEDTFDIGGL